MIKANVAVALRSAKSNWKNLLRRTCTVSRWQGERDERRVDVWGNDAVAVLDAPALAVLSCNVDRLIGV